MRDAFGSTFMFKILIIFIVVYVSFMTIAVGYAKAFRIKNGVIDILEQNQYDSREINDWNDIIINKVDVFLAKFAYNYPEENYPAALNHCNSMGGEYSDNGVCIITNDPINEREVYYTVVVYLIIDFPFFNYTPVIPIYGETENVALYE